MYYSEKKLKELDKEIDELHNKVIDPEEIKPPYDVDIMKDIPSHCTRSKYNLRSTNDISPDVINHRSVIEDLLLKPLSDDEDLKEYEKVTDEAQKLKDILDIDHTCLYDEELEEDSLFKIKEILDHKITEKGKPLDPKDTTADKDKDSESKFEEDDSFLQFLVGKL